MKLKTFNKANASRASVPGPYIGMSYKSGVFSINEEASTILGITENSKILVHQDEENPDQWYLENTTDPTGFTVRNKPNPQSKQKLYCFNASTITREIFASQKWKDVKSARVTIAPEPTVIKDQKSERKLFGIITVKARLRE